MTSRHALFLFVATQLLSVFTPSYASASAVSDLERQPRNVIGSAASPYIFRRADGSGYKDPLNGGGSMLTIVQGTYPAGLGEPLNVIVSSDSDKDVLVKSTDNGGFLNYMLSAGLGEECLGQSLGSKQGANLGDGQGNVTELETLRWNYGDPYLGTCRETFEGGLHLRYWIQNTTGAYFLAVSEEMDLASGHDIPPNGYNLGRNHLVGNVTDKYIEPRTVSNQTTRSGQSSWNNYTYQTDVQFVSGLLSNSSDDINHYLTVEQDGYPAIDGLVAVLTVKIVDRPQSSGAALTSSPAATLAIALPIVLSAIVSLL